MFKQKITAVAMILLLSVAAAANFNPKKTKARKAEATVTLTNFAFAPKVVRIKAGGTVTWKSKEGIHTVQADDGSFDSGTISAGGSFSKTFDKPGTYKYFCTLHGSAGGHDMAGKIIVTK